MESKALEKIATQFLEDPIVGHRPEPEPPHVTTKEHIVELQEILVQTCIDYIREHGLTDIYSVHFNADSLAKSVEEGSWQSGTESYLGVNGIRDVICEQVDGTTTSEPEAYLIGWNYNK